MGQLLREAADRFGDRTAAVFIHQGIRKTFREVLTDVRTQTRTQLCQINSNVIHNITKADQAAAGLLSLGLKRGDRIGIWGPNSYEWLLTQWAAARTGLILVTVSSLCKNYGKVKKKNNNI